MGYIGWELDQKEMGELRDILPPQFPDVIGHHITHTFGVGADTPLPLNTFGFVYGYALGDGVEALIVEIGGTTTRPDGKTYHITWSIDRAAGRKPADSNRMIEKSSWEPLPLRVPITLTPRYFD